MNPELPEAIQLTMLALTRGVRDALGDRVIGVYLGGSASMDAFHETASDLDFLVVTDGALTAQQHAALSGLHDRLRRETPLGDRLEGDYAPRDLLVPAGTLAPVPEVRDGHFHADVAYIMLSADNLVNVQEHGIAFFGPAPSEILPHVTPDDVRAAVREMLNEGPDAAETPEQAASELLNLVRSLCSLKSGAPHTKTAGAQWALDHLEARWRPAILAALAVRAGRPNEADRALVRQQLAPMYQSLWPPAAPPDTPRASQAIEPG